MAVEVLPVCSAKDLQVFNRFPGTVYRGAFRAPAFPLHESGPACDPLFNRVEAQAFLAVKNGYAVGRIAASIHHDLPDRQTGFFGFFESHDDTEVAFSLFQAAGRWLAARGRDKISGPVDLTPHERLGMLVEGFTGRHFPGMPYNPVYYDELIKRCGLETEIDLLAYQYDLRRPLPERVGRVAARAGRMREFSLRNIDFNNPAGEGEMFSRIHNESMKDVWGFVPLTPEEGSAIWGRLRGWYDPGLILVAEIAGEPAGLCLVLYARFSPGFSGRTGARLAVLAVRPPYRFKGLEAALLLESARRARSRGIVQVEISQVAQTNVMMNKYLVNLGITTKNRVYRIYKKRFNFCY